MPVDSETGQIELPDQWLKFGNPWEVPSLQRTYEVNFGGHTIRRRRPGGSLRVEWTNTHKVVGVAYDTPIDGYDNETVNTLRLWAARASREFDLEYLAPRTNLWVSPRRQLQMHLSDN